MLFRPLKPTFGTPPRRLRLLTIPLALGLTSCMVGPDFLQPEARIQGKWRQFSGGSDREVSAVEVQWWRQFRDPLLNSLVEQAYRNNPDLQAAGTRIFSARAELNHAVGKLFPQQQDLSLTAGRYSPSDSDGPISFLGNQNIFASQAILSATWEIDFWGKYRRQIQSDRARFLSSIAAYDSALVSLIADVVNTYINIRVAQERLRIARENVRLLQRNVEMAQARLEAGQVQGLDLAQATTQLSATEASIPLLQDAMDRQLNGLALLLGETPQETRTRFARGGGLPAPPSHIDVGLPRDLLRRRPDVRQAGLEAASQSARIGVAFAELLPSFSLTGSFGYGTGQNYTSLSKIFNWQQSVADAAGSLVVPILNYGRIVNQVRVEDAKFQQAILHYQNTVLRAQKEVEDAISAYVQSRNRLAHLQKAVENGNAAVRLATAQYEAGVTNYTTVLTAEQSRILNQDALAVTRGEVLIAVVSLYRALGGGWEIRDSAGVLSPETRRQMAERTNWGRLLEGVPSAAQTP